MNERISSHTAPSWSAKTMLLVPVYPEEVSVKNLAKATGRKAEHICSMIQALPSDFPLAERGTRRERFLCFPSKEAKRRAFEGVFNV